MANKYLILFLVKVVIGRVPFFIFREQFFCYALCRMACCVFIPDLVLFQHILHRFLVSVIFFSYVCIIICISTMQIYYIE